MSLEQLRTDLEDSGFNLSGTLSPLRFDSLVPEAWKSQRHSPGCRGILVVGNGGRALWSALERSPEATLRDHPLDRYTARVVREAADSVPAPVGIGLYWERRDNQYLPMMKLAYEAGLGSPGRLGILLHPVFGPWLAVRALLYLPFSVADGEPQRFDPCNGCPAPCATACLGQVVHESGLDPSGCFRTRVLKSACRVGCAARSACVVGPEHAYPPRQLEHHQRIRWRPSVLGHALRTLIADPLGRGRGAS